MGIGSRIKELRNQHNMSQTELSNLLQKSQSKIASMENKNSQITLNDIVVICEHFDCSADWLIFGRYKDKNIIDELIKELNDIKNNVNNS
jgi:transcriptional regulator with XRE-family HTH domain